MATNKNNGNVLDIAPVMALMIDRQGNVTYEIVPQIPGERHEKYLFKLRKDLKDGNVSRVEIHWSKDVILTFQCYGQTNDLQKREILKLLKSQNKELVALEYSSPKEGRIELSSFIEILKFCGVTIDENKDYSEQILQMFPQIDWYPYPSDELDELFSNVDVTYDEVIEANYETYLKFLNFYKKNGDNLNQRKKSN